MNSVEEDKYIGLHKGNSAAEESERLYLFFMSNLCSASSHLTKIFSYDITSSLHQRRKKKDFYGFCYTLITALFFYYFKRLPNRDHKG